MEKNPNVPQALHIFWDNAPHLSIPIMKKIKALFPSHQFALYKRFTAPSPFEKTNQTFSQIAGDQFYTMLTQQWCRNLFVKYPILNLLLLKFGFEFSFCTFLKLLFGPKHVIVHGRTNSLYNLTTLLLLKLFQKNIYLIHWGNKPSIGGRFLGYLDRFAYTRFSHVFVLMTPEIEYFKPFMGNKVSCLPYNLGEKTPSTFIISPKQNSRKLLLGNSAHFRETYQEILERLTPTDWEKVTCMLNYGDETTPNKTDTFVKKYQALFGDAFYAWRTTLPLDEYLQVLEESAFYICIAKMQTGLGAIANSIRQGKTLILRGDNYQWIKSLGAKVYNYDELNDLSFETLKRLQLTKEEALQNYNNYHTNFITKYTRDFWQSEITRVLTTR